MSSLGKDEKYHAFLAHGSSDSATANDIAKNLEAKGFKCIVGERDFPAGVPIINSIVQSIRESQKVILLVSVLFLKSHFANFEVAEALRKTYSKKRATLIPILIDVNVANLPSTIKAVNCIDKRKEGWFEHLVKALSETTPVSELVPTGDIAFGLAWSYYYGYLKLILPGLRDRAEQSEFAKSGGPPLMKKFISVMSETSRCPETFEKEDANFKTVGAIDFSITIAGNVQRSYKTAVHQVVDPRDPSKTYLFMGEFCTPLRTMYEMAAGGIAGLSEDQRKHQTTLFREKLKEILSHPSADDCINSFLPLPYRDVEVQSSSEVQGKQRLSELVCDAIEYELKIEEQIRLMQAQ
jgi:hypothetical protein